MSITLWGAKTAAFFDIWSIEHMLVGISIGSIVIKYHKKVFADLLGKKHEEVHSWHFNLAAALCLGFAWEAMEHYLETGLLGPAVQFWFHGVEFWGNRLITDPLMLVLGYALVKNYARLAVPARIFSVTWMTVHVFVFPHSMFLQEVLPVVTLPQSLLYLLPFIVSCALSCLYLWKYDSASVPMKPKVPRTTFSAFRR